MSEGEGVDKRWHDYEWMNEWGRGGVGGARKGMPGERERE
jgi:hypothetical protein